MENTKIREGGDIMLFITIAEQTYTLAFATSHKLTISAETVETSNKDNGGGKWVSKTARKLSWNISSENLYIEKSDVEGEKQKAFGDLFDLMVKREAIDVKFAEKGSREFDKDEIPEEGWNPSPVTYSGKAYITSLEANAPNGDNATYSVQLEGIGELKHTSLSPAL